VSILSFSHIGVTPTSSGDNVTILAAAIRSSSTIGIAVAKKAPLFTSCQPTGFEYGFPSYRNSVPEPCLSASVSLGDVGLSKPNAMVECAGLVRR
jgi:hypothetical protein